MRYTAPELLEGRIAPATLVSPTTVTYFDVDGDLVTVKTSAGTFTETMFQFDTAEFDDAGPQQLRLLDVSAATGIDLANLTITAKKVSGGTGDGFVNVGAIVADVDLTSVTVGGDLGRILSGGVADGSDYGLGILKVESLGANAGVSQGATINLHSVINGNLDLLTTKTDVRGLLEVTGELVLGTIGRDISGFGAEAGSGVIDAGSIGYIKVAGSITGVGSTAANGAGIHSDTLIGTIYVTGELRGGSGTGSGFISAGTTVENLTIIGGIVGNAADSATITAGGAVESITIGTGILGGAEGSASITTGTLEKLLVKGFVTGGDFDSARITVNGDLGAVRITGSLQGAGINTAVVTSLGEIGKMSVGAILGGGESSAQIRAEGAIGSINILGSIVGGDAGSAAISANALGKVKVGESIVGGSGFGSGQINAGTLGSVLVGGSLIGGEGEHSARIFGNEVGRVTIKQDVTGNALASATINAEDNLGSVVVGGAIVGGDVGSARIEAGGTIGKVRVTGSLIGGGSQSAVISSGDDIKYVRIGENIVGDRNDSASIVAFGAIGKVVIDGDLIGGDSHSARIVSSASPSEDSPIAIGRVVIGGNIVAEGLRSASVVANQGAIGAVTVNGSIQAGSLYSASIQAAGSIKSITVGQSVSPGLEGESAVFSSGAEIGRVTVGGHFGSSIRAESIGRVVIGTATAPADLAGGVDSGTGTINAENNIGSVIITGNVLGSVSGTGVISAGGNVQNISISGSLTGQLTESGIISIGGNLGRLTIGALSGTLGGSGFSEAAFVDVTGTIGLLSVNRITGAFNIGDTPIEHNASISAGRIGTAIFGDIVSGASTIPMTATSIAALNGIGTLTVTGSIQGSAMNPVTIAAGGQALADDAKKLDLAISKIAVAGNVSYTNILAGYDAGLQLVNSDAQIGSISIAGALTGSNIVAGVAAGDDTVFGTSDDVKVVGLPADSAAIISRIASITLGSVTPAATGTFGIAAEQIGALRIGGVAAVLKAGASNDLAEIATGFGLRELGYVAPVIK